MDHVQYLRYLLNFIDDHLVGICRVNGFNKDFREGGVVSESIRIKKIDK